jgi:DNA-binding NarL/FixJ family response regulator
LVTVTTDPATRGVIRVLIADDQRVVRDGLAALLGLCDGIVVVATTPDGESAVALVDELAPDVVLMDLRMPRMDGVQATREIVERSTSRVVVLTTYADDQTVLPALRAGAAGFVTKDADAEQIEAAIRAVYHGQRWLDLAAQDRLIEALNNPSAVEAPDTDRSDSANLTGREREVLGLIGDGLSNDEIGQRLVLTQATVKTHINRIFAKTGVRDRAQAVRYAIKHGISSTDFRSS